MTMKIGTEMPGLDGATDWVNGSPTEAETKLRGRPTLVHFWSVSCGICKENLPKVAEWRDRYGGNDLRVVAVHMPRSPADLDLGPVREAIAEYNITEPCAIDNEHKLRDSFLNEEGHVPAYYLFDKEGKLRSYAAGERGFGMVTAALRRLGVGPQ